VACGLTPPRVGERGGAGFYVSCFTTSKVSNVGQRNFCLFAEFTQLRGECDLVFLAIANIDLLPEQKEQCS